MKQHEKNKKKVFKSLIIFCGLLFLIYNLFSSQTLSPIYYRLIVGDQKAVVDFLEKIKFLPSYKDVYRMNGAIYGNTLADEINANENKKKETINNLEQILLTNPKERDILYSLYQLYLANGDQKTANDYLQKAKVIDPDIK